jgi:hypothetical protein
MIRESRGSEGDSKFETIRMIWGDSDRAGRPGKEGGDW